MGASEREGRALLPSLRTLPLLHDHALIASSRSSFLWDVLQLIARAFTIHDGTACVYIIHIVPTQFESFAAADLTETHDNRKLCDACPNFFLPIS
jgi:hypothetical protein